MSEVFSEQFKDFKEEVNELIAKSAAGTGLAEVAQSSLVK